MIRVVLIALAVAAGALESQPIPEFVEVPAGSFVMGADPARDPDAFDNERWPSPTGEGTLDLPTFYISRREITVAEFAAFVGATSWKVDQRALAGTPTHPVTFVSWPDAVAYTRWLEQALKADTSTHGSLRARLHNGWRVTLPNEAQWEKAARGGDRRKYPWGNEPRRDRANFASSGTMPAGQFACPECPYGLLDMSGNVWEWTSSPYRPYPFDARVAANLEADALWVMRGGAFADSARLVRTTARGAADPGARRPFIGFRVVLTPPAERAAPPS